MVDILTTIDLLDVFPRTHGRTPLVVLDGHDSCFEMPFLVYINDDNHKWAVVIVIPYGTALWQVGYSAEQNGSINLTSLKSNQEIVETKEMHTMLLTIEPWDVINVINATWNR